MDGRRRLAVAVALAACLAWLAVGPVAADVTNGGFETGTLSGWSSLNLVNAQTVTTATGPVHAGTYAGYANRSLSDSDSFFSQVTSSVSGASVSVTARVYRETSAASYEDRSLCLDGGPGLFYCGAAMSTLSTGGWALVSVTVPGTPAVTSWDVRLYVAGLTGTTGTFWDSVAFTSTAPTTTTLATTTTTLATTTTTTAPATTTTTLPPTSTTSTISPVLLAVEAQTDVVTLGLGLLVFCAFAALVTYFGRRS